MKLQVVCDKRVQVYRLLGCKVGLDRLPTSIVLSMNVRSRTNYTLQTYLKRSTAITVITSSINIQSLPEYPYCIKWSMHKLDFSLFLDELAVVSRVQELVLLCFNVKHTLSGQIEEGYVLNVCIFKIVFEK